MRTFRRHGHGYSIVALLLSACGSPASGLSPDSGGSAGPSSDAGTYADAITPVQEGDMGSSSGSDAAPGESAGDADDAGATSPEASTRSGATADSGGADSAAGPGSFPTLGALDIPTLFDAKDGSKDYLHTPIPANAVVDPNSATILSNVDVPASTPGFGGTASWLIPMYATHDSDPSYTPSYSEDWGCAVNAPMHIPDLATRELPGASTPGDAWILTVNLDTNDVAAVWQADKGSGTWNGACAGSFPLHGNGFKASAGVGAGGGEQIGAGIILQSELLAGHIDHALYTSSAVTCTTFREPATKSDGHGSGQSCLPMGTRIQLDPSVDCDALGASKGETMICHTVQTYGFYILDSGGGGPIAGVSIQADDLLDPNRVPWAQPGNPFRGAANCGPHSATCGVAASVGLVGSANKLKVIPWDKLRILAHWDGT